MRKCVGVLTSKFNERLDAMQTALGHLWVSLSESAPLDVPPSPSLGGDVPLEEDWHGSVGDLVRLYGLSSSELNGRAGTITKWREPRERFSISLHGEDRSVAIRPKSSCRYRPEDSDICPGCAARFNLNAFPRRDCHPLVASPAAPLRHYAHPGHLR